MPEHPASSELELLTLPKAAELLRAPMAALRYWRHLGTGPRSFRLGRRVVYRLADVRAWIEAQHHRDDAVRGREPAGSRRPEPGPREPRPAVRSDSATRRTRCLRGADHTG